MSEDNTKNIKTHDKYTDIYVAILEQYKKQIDTSVNKKNDLKEHFFNLIKFIMIFLLLLFAICVMCAFVVFGLSIKFHGQFTATIIGAITAIISSFITMLLAIIKLPKIIAMYLFNKKEDKLMNEIIKNIQKYEIKAVNIDEMALLQNNIVNNDNIIDVNDVAVSEPESKNLERA